MCKVKEERKKYRGDEKRAADHHFILIWIMAQKVNAIKWEWLFGKGVPRSLGEFAIGRLDTVFVM